MALVRGVTVVVDVALHEIEDVEESNVGFSMGEVELVGRKKRGGGRTLLG